MTAISWVLREIAAQRLLAPAHVVAGLEVALDAVLDAYADAVALGGETMDERARG